MTEFPTFLRLNIPLYVYATSCLPILLLAHIWAVSTFGLLWVMLLWTLVYTFCISVFNSSGYIQRRGTANNSFFSILKNCQTAFQSNGTTEHFHQQCVYKGSNFSKSSPTLFVFHVYDYSYHSRFEELPQCGSDLCFSNDRHCWASFHVTGHTCIFTEKCLFKSFAHFLMSLIDL